MNRLQAPKQINNNEDNNSFFGSIDNMFSNPGENLRKIAVGIFKFFVVIFFILSIISLIASISMGVFPIFLITVIGSIVLLIPIGITCLLMCGLGDLISKVNSIDQKLSEIPESSDEELPEL